LTSIPKLVTISTNIGNYFGDGQVMIPRNELLNLKTGEIYDGLAIVKKKRYPRNTEFMTMFREGWKYIAKLKLKPTETSVLCELMARLDYDNWIPVCQETIAEELGLKKPHVSRAIKALVEYEILEREQDPADKRRWTYRLNADIGWKGDANQWKKHQQERLESSFGGDVIVFPRGFESQDNYEPVS